jgi:uncharacterized DUF497 family protein
MIFEWNDEKNLLLKQMRNICFEDVVLSIHNGNLLDFVKNPSLNHSNQYCMIVDIANYVYVVPFVKNGQNFFLKTVYPSRKMTKKYLKEQL